ncbi:MAG: hypothetical protein ABIH01_01700 [Candidatus Omnitrophota bacterium]
MIKVDLSSAVAVYLILWLLGFVIAWVLLEKKPVLPNYPVDARYIWHCHICTNTYVDSISEDISVCPMCKSYNNRKEVKT